MHESTSSATHSVADMCKTFKQVNIHLAAGPDGLPGHARACADQLASVFTDIFNLSLTESVIPTCFKQITIVPVPKKANVTCLNDYRHVESQEVLRKAGHGSQHHHPRNPRPTNSHTAPTNPQITQSHSTLPFPTWTRGTLM